MNGKVQLTLGFVRIRNNKGGHPLLHSPSSMPVYNGVGTKGSVPFGYQLYPRHNYPPHDQR